MNVMGIKAECVGDSATRRERACGIPQNSACASNSSIYTPSPSSSGSGVTKVFGDEIVNYFLICVSGPRMENARVDANNGLGGGAAPRLSWWSRFWQTRSLELGLFFAPAPWKRGSVFHTMAQHPGIWIPCWALHLIVIWWLGRKFGLPLLFWHDEPLKAIVAGAIFALTFGFFIFVYFVLDYSAYLKERGSVPDRSEDDGGKSKNEVVLPHWTKELEKYFLRNSGPEADGADPERKRFSEEVQLQSFLFRSLSNAFAYLITALILLRLAIYFGIHRPWEKTLPSSASHGNFDIWNESVRFEDGTWWLFIIGMAIGAILVLVLDVLKFVLIPGLKDTRMGDAIPVFSLFDPKLKWSQETVMMVLGFWAFFIVVFFHLVFLLLGELWGFYFAAPAICIMLAWLVFGYAILILQLRAPFWRSWVLVIAVLAVGAFLLPRLPNRYGFAQIEKAAETVKTSNIGNGSERRELSPVGMVYPRTNVTDSLSQQMAALKSTEAKMAEEIAAGKIFADRGVEAKWGEKPLVVVCASGGGITAEVWTLETLALLSQLLPDFAPQVRLITGASGGMVGAAAWAGWRHKWQDAPVDPLINRAYRDQLSPLALRFALFDSAPTGFLLQRYVPWLRHFDRGEALEEVWINSSGRPNLGVLPELGSKLGEMAPGEVIGKSPSLLFSPTIAEQGRPLLISNLDVTLLTQIDLPGPFPDQRRDRVHRAVDARKLLGGAIVESVPIATWARMSATFPLVSPAGSIEFDLNNEDVRNDRSTGRIHLVDAAYADNQGSSLAVTWLRSYWLPWTRNSQKVPRHVILIEIDAFPRYGDKAFDGARPPNPYLDGLSACVEDVHIPTVGLGNRMKSHLFHTDRMMERFAEEVKASGSVEKPLTFSSYRFVNPIPCSLSWSLAAGERNGLRWFQHFFKELRPGDAERIFEDESFRKGLIDRVNAEVGKSPINPGTDPFVNYTLREFAELEKFWRLCSQP